MDGESSGSKTIKMLSSTVGFNGDFSTLKITRRCLRDRANTGGLFLNCGFIFIPAAQAVTAAAVRGVAVIVGISRLSSWRRSIL